VGPLVVVGATDVVVVVAVLPGVRLFVEDSSAPAQATRPNANGAKDPRQVRFMCVPIFLIALWFPVHPIQGNLYLPLVTRAAMGQFFRETGRVPVTSGLTQPLEWQLHLAAGSQIAGQVDSGYASTPQGRGIQLYSGDAFDTDLVHQRASERNALVLNHRDWQVRQTDAR
jgi:hypothetical protein